LEHQDGENRMSKHLIISEKQISSKIYFVRGERVMLDRDLAEMYKVTTGNLNLAVRRKKKRFPHDFMFQLTKSEFRNLILQSAISRWGGTRTMPYVFTEQGVSMLSSVLNSDIAIEVNIQIMRVFTKIGKLLSTHKDILLKLEQFEKKLIKQNSRTGKLEKNMMTLFDAIRELIDDKSERDKPRKRIGYKLKGED
jgi:ORF6N domain